MVRNRWTVEELETLRKLYPDSKMAEILKSLPRRNRGSIYTKANDMGIKRDIVDASGRSYAFSEEHIQKLVRSHTQWTEEQETLLGELYHNTKSKDLESIFPEFSAVQISTRAQHIGLQKDYEFFVQTGMEGAAGKWGERMTCECSRARGPNWNQTRRSTRYRAKYKCEWCGIREEERGRRLSAHHVIPFEEFGYIVNENRNYKQANRQSNLVALCVSCHGYAEQVTARHRLELLEYFREHPREQKIEERQNV